VEVRVLSSAFEKELEIECFEAAIMPRGFILRRPWQRFGNSLTSGSRLSDQLLYAGKHDGVGTRLACEVGSKRPRDSFEETRVSTQALEFAGL
jgi:hypothetical protein